MDISSSKSLPENAYRSLKPGESYTPIVPAGSTMQEFTPRSVTLGILMAVLFSAAAAFLGLKVGQVFEAAIPISILAVGMGLAFKRRSTILENVIVQSVGAASGLVVAGSIFTLPALFILGLDVNLVKLFLVAVFGGTLGLLFLVPLRRYFVKEMHGEFPFPEATATTEVLVAGEAGGAQAKVLVLAAAVGGIFDFLVIHLEAFAEVFTTRSVPFLKELAEKGKLVFKLDVLASVAGLGYIIGLKYSAIICAGSFLSWFLLRPARGALRAVPDGRDPARFGRDAHLHDERRGDLPELRETHRDRRDRRGRDHGNPPELADHREGFLSASRSSAAAREGRCPRRPSGPTGTSRWVSSSPGSRSSPSSCGSSSASGRFPPGRAPFRSRSSPWRS